MKLRKLLDHVQKKTNEINNNDYSNDPNLVVNEHFTKGVFSRNNKLCFTEEITEEEHLRVKEEFRASNVRQKIDNLSIIIENNKNDTSDDRRERFSLRNIYSCARRDEYNCNKFNRKKDRGKQGIESQNFLNESSCRDLEGLQRQTRCCNQ